MNSCKSCQSGWGWWLARARLQRFLGARTAGCHRAAQVRENWSLDRTWWDVKQNNNSKTKCVGFFFIIGYCCTARCQTSVSDLWLAVAAVSAGYPLEVSSAYRISYQGFVVFHLYILLKKNTNNHLCFGIVIRKNCTYKLRKIPKTLTTKLELE